MENYLLPWTWYTGDPDESYWTCKVTGARTKQVKDFRSLTAQAIAGGAGGYCWVTSAVPLPVIPDGGLYLGSEPSARLNLGKRRGITGLFPHLAATDLDAEDSLWDVLWKLTLELADPTGAGSWKPLRGSVRHGFKVTLGDEVRHETFNPLHRSWGPTLEIFRADYRRNRQIVNDPNERLGMEDIQRFTGRQMLKYGIADSRDLLPLEYRDEGSLGHRSPFSDTFTDTNGTALESHTPSVGTSWEVVANAIDIQSNRAEGNDTTNIESIYRLSDALDSDDHFVEADLSSHWSPDGNPLTNDAEVMGRKHGTLATLTMYEARMQLESTLANVHNELFKRITGTTTEIGSGSSTFTVVEDQDYLTRLTMQADDTITVDRETVEVISEASQTDITGNLYSGIILDAQTTTRINRADNFLCNDLAAPPAGFVHSQAVIIG